MSGRPTAFVARDKLVPVYVRLATEAFGFSVLQSINQSVRETLIVATSFSLRSNLYAFPAILLCQPIQMG